MARGRPASPRDGRYATSGAVAGSAATGAAPAVPGGLGRMTLEIDLERVAAVTTALGHHGIVVESVRRHLLHLSVRMDLHTALAPALAAADRSSNALATADVLLTRLAERARRADLGAEPGSYPEPMSFAGGTVLCSAIQLASPVPARPSTSGATGVIDVGGIASDAGSLLGTASQPVRVAGRAAPLTSLGALAADTALCRLRVGSGAPISTATTVDDRGETVYEGSRSRHKYMAANGEVLDPDPVRRDRQMWRIEHSNEAGHLTEPYPGYPAYEVNAPRG